MTRRNRPQRVISPVLGLPQSSNAPTIGLSNAPVRGLSQCEISPVRGQPQSSDSTVLGLLQSEFSPSIGLPQNEFSPVRRLSCRAILSLLALLLLLLPAACSSLRPTAEHAPHPNPVLIKVRDQDFVWEHIACVMGDYFRIEREDRVKRLGDVLTEGTLETSYEVGATLLEPWRSDSAGTYNQVESTLQTIRRRAVVKVVPASGGYLVEVQVFKELEDLARPQNGSAADAMFRFDGGLPPLREPVGPNPPTLGWIPLGRDTALEQRIIARFLSITGP